jgi:glutamyl/glutaminyl-tRNA synthetase
VVVSSAIAGDFGLMPDLPGAEMGKVVTRFPPEPSGHLHIGHVKAMVLNHAYARRYGGVFRVRFDDTNPSNEKEEYEHAIVEDLQRLGMKPDVVSWTSDYFDVFLKHCTEMIERGDAFVDDSTAEVMQAERRNVDNPTAGGIDSKNRNNSVEQNLKMWSEMQQGTTYGFTCCVRAKMNMQSKNATMRDPVIYRCSASPHARTKDKYKVYPTYDLACPIVDSLEGVTHAMRDMAYADRVEQYMWFLEKLSLRNVRIQDFSRINFNYTVLSKRMLAGLVDVGAVDGWDDPRMPTIKGILRRGMTVVGLRHFMLKQGASRKVNTEHE